MHVQIVTFGLGGASEREFLDAANQAAPAFSAMGGLLAKVWLENEDEGRYGALYFWDDREAMEEAMRRHGHLIEGGPAYSDAAMEDFSVLENLTRQTQPVLEVVEPKAPPPRRAAAAGGARKAMPAGGAKKPAGARKAGAPAKKPTTAKKASAPAARKKAAGSGTRSGG